MSLRFRFLHHPLQAVYAIESWTVTAAVAPVTQAVYAIENWLSGRGYWGPGVDGLISAFFDPDGMGRQLRKALDRAGVEQASAGDVTAMERRWWWKK